jgi:group I intron endonuclease
MSATNYYFLKLHYDIIDDWKVGTLPDSLKWRFIQCLCVAGECQDDGLLPEINQFAYRIRQEPSSLNSDMARLSANGLVELILLENGDERWFITNYTKRQEKKTSTQRTRDQRARDRAMGIKREYWQKSLYENLPEEPGIYQLGCTATNKVYIGGSKNIKKRVRAHLTEINTGGHAMTDDIKEYGKASITIEVLELVKSLDAIVPAENRWMSAYDKTHLYNDSKTPGKRHRSWIGTDEEHKRDEGGTVRPQNQNQNQNRVESEENKILMSAIAADYAEILQLWKETFPKKPQPRANNKTLQGKLKTRMKVPHFRESWREALVRAGESKFLHSGSFFDLAWFLHNDNNYEKCLNGNYKDRNKPETEPETEHLAGSY